jgi:hypothetical protein
MATSGITVGAHDVAIIVDPVGDAVGGARVNGAENACREQETMATSDISVGAHDMAIIVDSIGAAAVRDIDRGEGIRGVLGSRETTEHDAEGQDRRNEMASHGFTPWICRETSVNSSRFDLAPSAPKRNTTNQTSSSLHDNDASRRHVFFPVLFFSLISSSLRLGT